jgi:sec-independent protein translocase protein TatC
MLLQKNQNSDLTVLDHIIELRTRAIISVTSIIVGSAIAHFFHEQIISFILKPIGGQKLVFLSPLDPLFFILKIDLVVGILISLPILVWSVFSYIRPVITNKINYILYIIYTSSTLLVLTALSYAYFIIVPLILKFLSSITIPGIESTITAQNYLGFFITQILIITLIFQIPLFIIFGIYIGIFSTRLLGSKRGYIYVGITIALSILTPTPDIFSLGIILIPALFIFEVSLIIGRVVERFRKKKSLVL